MIELGEVADVVSQTCALHNNYNCLNVQVDMDIKVSRKKNVLRRLSFVPHVSVTFWQNTEYAGKSIRYSYQHLVDGLELSKYRPNWIQFSVQAA